MHENVFEISICLRLFRDFRIYTVHNAALMDIILITDSYFWWITHFISPKIVWIFFHCIRHWTTCWRHLAAVCGTCVMSLEVYPHLSCANTFILDVFLTDFLSVEANMLKLYFSRFFKIKYWMKSVVVRALNVNAHDAKASRLQGPVASRWGEVYGQVNWAG